MGSSKLGMKREARLSDALTLRLAQEVRSRSLSSAWGGFVLFLLLGYVLSKDPVPEGFPRIILAGGFASIFFSCAIRLYLFYQVKPFSLDRLSNKISALAILGGAGWGAISEVVYTHASYGVNSTQMTIMILSGVSASSVSSLAAKPRAFAGFIFTALWIPVLLSSVQKSEKITPEFVFLVLAYSGFLWSQVKVVYRSLIERFTNEAQLREERNLLRTIFEAVPGYISYLDSDLKYLSMNPNLEKAMGITREQYLGKSIGFLGGGNTEWVSCVTNFAKSDAQELRSEITIKAFGENRWNLVSMKKNGNTGMIVCVAIDIHNERLMAIEAEEQRGRANHSSKMAALGEMSSGIAHEINNPLAVIGAKAHLLKLLVEQKKTTDEQLIKDANTVEQMVGRISKIISGLKMFARDSTLDPHQIVSLQTIFEETLVFCEGGLKRRGIEMSLPKFDSDLDIECHPTQISQVILNLINNASDAVDELSSKSPDQSLKKWIKVEVEGEQNSILIRIIDCGSGIPDPIREKILQPFFTTKDIGKGTGLGLSIASGIIKAHQGELLIPKDVPHTTFCVRMPRRQRQG